LERLHELQFVGRRNDLDHLDHSDNPDHSEHYD
jgi:hypothetical protein